MDADFPRHIRVSTGECSLFLSVYVHRRLLRRCVRMLKDPIDYQVDDAPTQSTDLGCITSHFYVTYDSMATYPQHLQSTMITAELFHTFAISKKEPQLVPVRQEEKLELTKLWNTHRSLSGRAWKNSSLRLAPCCRLISPS